MRISTSMLFKSAVSAIQGRTVDQNKLQQQLSTGRNILTPSDDPVSSSKILDVMQSQAMNTQYNKNTEAADSVIRLAESSLNQATSVIQDIKTLMVNAGNPTLTNSEKKMLDAELRGKYSELLGIANATDGNGQYLFSGYQGSTKPFNELSFGNVRYDGDQGQRLVQISPSRQLPASDPGDDIFLAKTGNATFTTAVASNNRPFIIGPGSVTDLTAWNQAANTQQIRIEMLSVQDPNAPSGPPIVKYDLIVNDTTSVDYNKSLVDGYDYNGGARPIVPGTPNPYPRTYSSESDIQFKQLTGEATPLIANWDFGARVQMGGMPADGSITTAGGVIDTFTITPSAKQDVFTLLGNFSTALNAYQPGDPTAATFQNQLNGVMSNLDNILTRVLEVQAGIGSRMKELESVRNTNEDVNLQYKSTLSSLQDLDYAKAISEFTLNETYLDAARKSFSQIQRLSLFEYIN